MNESDLLLVFGASFSNHTGIAPYKPIVQVDFDPMALGRFHPVTVPVLGHVGVTARPCSTRVDRGAPGGDRVDQRAEVADALGDLAGREGAARSPTTAAAASRRRRVRRAEPPRRTPTR